MQMVLITKMKLLIIQRLKAYQKRCSMLEWAFFPCWRTRCSITLGKPAVFKFVRRSVFERDWWTGEDHCLGPAVVGRQGSEVTDGQESKIGGSESMGDSIFASEFGSKSESRSSAAFPSRGRGGKRKRKERNNT